MASTVLCNLRATERHVGFQFFQVKLMRPDRCAQVTVFTSGNGATVRLWGTAEKLDVCGNDYFDPEV